MFVKKDPILPDAELLKNRKSETGLELRYSPTIDIAYLTLTLFFFIGML